MKIDRRAFIGGTLLGGAVLAMPAQALAWARNTTAYPRLAQFVSGFVERDQLPGTLATIGQGFGAPQSIAAGTLANDSRRAVDIDSLWRVYSMTKPITGIAAMILIDEGKLKLDQPLADILPAFADMHVLKSPTGALADTVPANRPITIRHLLTHTAGFSYTLDQTGPIREAYNRYGLIGGEISRMAIPGISDVSPAPGLEEFAKRLARLPLISQPGARWSYSASFDLLGRVIEVVSGLSLDRFLSRKLFVPLDMKSSFFQVPQSQVARLTTNYSPLGPLLFPIDPGASSIFLDRPAMLFGGAGLVMSARDYDRFLMMLLGEGAIGDTRVISAATARLAMSNLLPAGATTAGTFIAGHGFGAGGRVSLPGSVTGEGIFGWSGAAGTIAWVDPKRRLRVAGYAQYMPPTALDFQAGFARAFMQDML